LFCALASTRLTLKEQSLAKNQNTFEKRRREVEKRQRAEDKRKRRQQRKIDGPEPLTRDEQTPPDDLAQPE
jgi:hypothetical protein